MKLIKPSFEILTPTDWRKQGIEQFIEFVGRTCYKSEDKITNDSYNGFVQRMLDNKHYAMLEHGTVYITASSFVYLNKLKGDYDKNKYSIVKEHFDDKGNMLYYITTNYRVLIENGWLNDLRFITEPTEYHAKRITVKFICNRQVSHEFVRHRVFSFAQESTRYCNYTKDKFDNELTFIIPNWVDENKNKTPDSVLVAYLTATENTYNYLIKNSWKPQQAATILPNALKTELVMTGFIEDWKHFFDLRALEKTGPAHPQAKELALSLYNKFIELDYIDE